MRLTVDSTAYFEIRGEPGKAATISSNLRFEDADCPEDLAWNRQIDALESLVLAHFVAGLDVLSEAYRNGLKTTLEAVGNYA